MPMFARSFALSQCDNWKKWQKLITDNLLAAEAQSKLSLSVDGRIFTCIGKKYKIVIKLYNRELFLVRSKVFKFITIAQWGHKKGMIHIWVYADFASV